jgi:hypothetical protein
VALEVQGALFAGFPASLERSMGVTYEAIADDRGFFSLSSLPAWSGLELVASRAGHTSARAEVPVASRLDLELVLIREGTLLTDTAPPPGTAHLRGALFDENGEPLRSWIVSAIPADRAAECRAMVDSDPLCDEDQGVGRDADDLPYWLSAQRGGSGRNSAGAQSDEDGSFDVGGLTPGVAYEVIAYDPDSLASVTSAPTEPGEVGGAGGSGAAGFDGLVLEAPRGESLRPLIGSVRTQDGAAVAGASIRLALVVPGPNGPRVVFGASARAGDDGSFVLEGRPGLALFIERNGVSAGFYPTRASEGAAVYTVDRSAAFLAHVEAFSARSGSISLVDRAGRELSLTSLGGVSRRLDLHRGWTVPFSVDEDAAAAVVYDEDGEVEAELPLDELVPLTPLLLRDPELSPRERAEHPRSSR